MKRTNTGWILLAIISLIYVIIYFFNPRLIIDSLGYFLNILKQVAPILLVVFVLIFLFSKYLGAKKITQYLANQSGQKGMTISIFAGILSMGAAYIWYPLLKEVQEEGTSPSLIAAFLYAKSIKPQLFPLLIYYFGLNFSIVLTLYMILSAVISGYLTNKLVSTKQT
jgi:uncharacterized membrane protein YraQ (UPF0718 family)